MAAKKSGSGGMFKSTKNAGNQNWGAKTKTPTKKSK